MPSLEVSRADCKEAPGSFVPMPSLLVPPILDVEASGFGAGSYPIEVGYVLGDGTAYCTLIQPAASWTHWDLGTPVFLEDLP